MVITLSTCKYLHIASYLRLGAAFGRPASLTGDKIILQPSYELVRHVDVESLNGGFKGLNQLWKNSIESLTTR